MQLDINNASKYSPLNAEQISKYLPGIEGKSKSNSILQIADLCLYIATVESNLRSEAMPSGLSPYHK